MTPAPMNPMIMTTKKAKIFCVGKNGKAEGHKERKDHREERKGGCFCPCDLCGDPSEIAFGPAFQMRKVAEPRRTECDGYP